MDFVHRNVVGATSVLVPMIFSNSIINFFSAQYFKLGSTKCAARLIGFVRNLLWPGGKKAPVNPNPWPNPVAAQQALQARLGGPGVPAAAAALFGQAPCERAARRLFGFLQDELLLKNLVWCVADLLVVELWPELAGEVDAVGLLHDRLALDPLPAAEAADAAGVGGGGAPSPSHDDGGGGGGGGGGGRHLGGAAGRQARHRTPPAAEA
uniref:Sorting nexin C-terminal domain-containing protein n=2 Tax=Heterosigma akashiwo TaxID=2829 RepID=A0A7S4DAK3_HETAK